MADYLSGLVVANLVRELDEAAQLRCGEAAEGLFLEAVDLRVVARQELLAARGDAAPDLPAVLARALALHELLLDQAVDEPRDARRALDHALADLERGQARLAGAAQDAQHVVLLQRQ